MTPYDIVIIGSGPGGYVAALYAARKGKKVCVVEKDALGGTCLNRGCIPAKSLIHSASLYRTLKGSAPFGIRSGDVGIDYRTACGRMDETVSSLRTGLQSLFKMRGIDILTGTGSIVDGNTVRVGNGRVSAGHLIVAVGSRPSAVAGIACDQKKIMDSDGFLAMRDLPRSCAIIGGGAIGLEFAYVLSACGTAVTIIEAMDRIAPYQSREVSRRLSAAFQKLGMRIFTGTTVAQVTAGETTGLILSDGSRVDADRVLVAAGRNAAIEGIGLSEAGIETDKGRIRVDRHLRTTARTVYAIGDCTPGPLLAHRASYDAIVACDNICGEDRETNYDALPSCIYTDPEVAIVGKNEEEVRARHEDATVARFPFSALGKARILGKTEGFVKVVGSRSCGILGVEIIGEGACDIIAQASIALSTRMTAEDLARVIIPHPTLSESFHEAILSYCGNGVHAQ